MTCINYTRGATALNIALERPKSQTAAAAADKKKFTLQAPVSGFCGPAKREAGGAGKSIVTDYTFVVPGFATHKHVGWGEPQTPSASSIGGAA